MLFCASGLSTCFIKVRMFRTKQNENNDLSRSGCLLLFKESKAPFIQFFFNYSVEIMKINFLYLLMIPIFRTIETKFNVFLRKGFFMLYKYYI